MALPKDMPDGTRMMDHKTGKVYVYKEENSQWVLETNPPRPRNKASIPSIEVKEWHRPVKTGPTTPDKNDIVYKLEQKYHREPTKYNLYMQQQIKAGAYAGLPSRDRFKKIAEAWKLQH